MRTLLFESRNTLYTIPWPLPCADKRRRVAALQSPEYKDSNWWAVSPDGRHIVYISVDLDDLHSAHGGRFNGLFDEPSVVRIASLPGLHFSRILFTLPGGYQSDNPFYVAPHALRSPNGTVLRSISRGSKGHDDSDFGEWSGDTDMRNWAVVALPGFCGNASFVVTLHRCSPGDTPAVKSCIVHLRRSCTGMTDRQGQWQSVGSITNADVQGGLLVGTGIGRTNDAAKVCNACSRYSPIHIVDLAAPYAERCLLTSTFDSNHVPPYGFAECPTFSRDRTRIVFYSYGSRDETTKNPGIWLVDRHSGQYHRVSDLDRVRQLYWETSSSLLVLKQTGKLTDSGSTDLFRLPLHDGGRRAGKPTLLLDDVDRFQVIDSAV